MRKKTYNFFVKNVTIKKLQQKKKSEMQTEKPSDFNEIEDSVLRAYNRAVIVYNLMNDEGEIPASNYFVQFSVEDKSAIIQTLVKIRDIVSKKKNISDLDIDANFKDSLTKDLNLPENKEELYVN